MQHSQGGPRCADSDSDSETASDAARVVCVEAAAQPASKLLTPLRRSLELRSQLRGQVLLSLPYSCKQFPPIDNRLRCISFGVGRGVLATKPTSAVPYYSTIHTSTNKPHDILRIIRRLHSLSLPLSPLSDLAFKLPITADPFSAPCLPLQTSNVMVGPPSSRSHHPKSQTKLVRCNRFQLPDYLRIKPSLSPCKPGCFGHLRDGHQDQVASNARNSHQDLAAWTRSH